MANSVRNESSVSSGHAAGQPPIVLARLPRIGAESLTPSAPAPPPESMPQLDLRSEIDQRTRLNIASTPDDGSASVASHFVDRHHTSQPQQTKPFFDAQPALAKQSAPQAAQPQTITEKQSRIEKQSLSEKMFELHGQLAPHAGLIVALALIASAGLLYWMLVGPAHAPVPNYENYGQPLEQNGFGAATDQLPEDYLPEFEATVPQAVETDDQPDLWSDVPLTEPQPDDAPPQLAQPEIGPTASQDFTTEAATPFPMTTQPEPLDFSKIGSVLPAQTAEVPQPLPSVAQRKIETLHR